MWSPLTKSKLRIDRPYVGQCTVTGGISSNRASIVKTSLCYDVTTNTLSPRLKGRHFADDIFLEDISYKWKLCCFDSLKRCTFISPLMIYIHKDIAYNFLRSLISDIFSFITIRTPSTWNTTFIFNRCPRSLAAMTPVKYEYDLTDVMPPTRARFLSLARNKLRERDRKRAQDKSEQSDTRVGDPIHGVS